MTKKIYIVYTNTDLTEGRGWEVPLYYCENEATAKRLGKGRYVQGTDCPYFQYQAKAEGSKWLAPVHIIKPSDEDLKQEKQMLEERAKQMLLDKFKAGEDLTPEERAHIVEMLVKISR